MSHGQEPTNILKMTRDGMVRLRAIDPSGTSLELLPAKMPHLRTLKLSNTGLGRIRRLSPARLLTDLLKCESF